MEGKAKAPQPPPAECIGNACGDVSISYLGWGRGLLFKNASFRRVGIRVRWDIGFSCLDWSNLELSPGESKRVRNHGYCSPLQANHIKQDNDLSDLA